MKGEGEGLGDSLKTEQRKRAAGKTPSKENREVADVEEDVGVLP